MTTDTTTLRDRALQMLATGPFLMLGAPIADMAPVWWQAAQPPLAETEVSTWLPAEAVAFTVMCIADPMDGRSPVFVLYDQEQRALYYLRRDAWVDGCPLNTTLLAHYVEDRVDNDVTRGQLLVFDILRYRGEQTAGMDAAARHGLLRKVGDKFNRAVMSVQWAGEHAALVKFVASGQITHAVRGPLALCSDPLRPMLCAST